MKQTKSIFYLMVLVLSMGFSFTACSDDEDNVSLEEVIVGTWKVVAYSPTSADTLIDGTGLFKEFYFGTDKRAKFTTIYGSTDSTWAIEGDTVTATQGSHLMIIKFISFSSTEAVCYTESKGVKLYVKIQKH